jgi:ribonuclease-3
LTATPDLLGDLQARLGYRFAQPALLQEALTHASVGGGRDNQRLEFLGDALLNVSVALLLYRERPDWQEGLLSKLRGVLVRTESLYLWAKELGVDKALKSVHPRKAPPMGHKPLADAVEALLAAIYLDAQGSARDGSAVVLGLVEGRFLEPIREARAETWTLLDPKTHLQETAARLGLPAPIYAQLAQTGPGHAPRFTMQVQVGDLMAKAEGASRKGAEGAAAQQLLQQIGKRPRV